MANRYTDAAFAAKGLTGTDKLVLWVLCHRTDNEKGTCFPSYARIAQDAGISRSGAMRAVKSLIRLGLVNKVGTRGYKNGEETNVFQVSLVMLREMAEPRKEKDAGSAAQPDELRNDTGVVAQGSSADCVAQPTELRNEMVPVAQSYSNSELNSEFNSELNSSSNSSTNSESLVDHMEVQSSNQSENQDSQSQAPPAGYPSYTTPKEEEGAIVTQHLEILVGLWIAQHPGDEEPDEYSVGFNLMALIWEGNPSGSPNLEIAEQIEEVLRWLPKSNRWDKPKPEGLGRFNNSAEFCKAYPAIRKSYLKYMKAVEGAKG